MAHSVSFKRLILRAVLRPVSPMVIRLISVSDQLQLSDFHAIFRAVLGWDGDLGYIIRIHGQEFNSFHRKTRSGIDKLTAGDQLNLQMSGVGPP
jgi:hypothetical protein